VFNPESFSKKIHSSQFMKKLLAFQTMIAISGLAIIPFYFARAQSVLQDEVIPGQEVKPEDRGKGEPAKAPENGNAAKGRGKGNPTETPENENAAKRRGKGNPTESPESENAAKGRGKREPGKSGKSRDREPNPPIPAAQNLPVPVAPVARIPMTPPVQTPPAPETPSVPQTALNPQTGGKGIVRDNPSQPRGTPGNRPPNISKGGPKESPRQPAPDPVQKMPPADPKIEKEITQTTERVEKEVNQKKTAIKTEAEALDIIRKVIGGDSEISRSENLRDRRIESDRLRDSRPENKDPARDASVSFLLKRFQGKASLSDAPPSMRQVPRPPSTRQDDRRFPDRDQRPGPDNDPNRGLDRQHPVYNGYRHVRFKSRGEIPAILLAVSALNRVQIRNYNELSYLPPNGFEMVPEYRDQSSPVVSYQVDPNSMVSRDDILFLQGSTSFADRDSFETVRDLAVAMGDPSLSRERFVVEGHASAEGGYDSNLTLSQRRAERIVRDIVRFGVSEDRLVPVGYGESEAAYSASDPNQYRRLDRKVVIFRLSK